jgi:hypothetical protein
MHSPQEQPMNLRIALITALSLTLVAACDAPSTAPSAGTSADSSPSSTCGQGLPGGHALPPSVGLTPQDAPIAQYPAPLTVDTGASVSGLAVMDSDGDGVEELVTVDGMTFTLWTTTDEGLAPSGLSFSSDEHIYAFHSGDFDGDGADELLLELSTSWQLLEVVAGHLNVTHSLDRDPTKGTTGLIVADADADGRDDLILHDPACATTWSHWESHCGDRRLEILGAGGQDGLAEMPLEYAFRTWMTLADLTGDGVSEVVRCGMVETGTHPAHTAVTVMDLSSDGLDVMATYETPPGVRLEQPWTGDLDGDGVLEVLARDVNSNTVLAFSYQDGALSRLADIKDMPRFEAVDLGGHAGAEMIVGSRVLQVHQPALFHATTPPTSFVGGAHVAFMDVDQDGLKDVVTAMPEGQMQVLFADGSGGLRGWPVYPTGEWMGVVQTADVGHDGRADVIGTRADGQGTTLLVNEPKLGLVNSGVNLGGYHALVMDCAESTHAGGLLCAGSTLFGFGADVDGDLQAQALLPHFLVPCGLDGWLAPIPHLATGDFDGDGLEDVVVSMQHFTVRPEFFDQPSDYWDREGTVLVFMGTVDGGLAFDQFFQRDLISTDVTAMDVDGDGVDELIIIDAAGALETWRPVDGLWTMDDVTAHEEALFGLQVVDTDDAQLLLARTAETQQVLVFGASDGVLAAASALSFEGLVVSLTLADLDLDGDDDLIAATELTDGIWASLQTDGAFGEPVALVRPGMTPASIAAADLDLDGCPDIAASFRGVKGIVTIPGQCQAD